MDDSGEQKEVSVSSDEKKGENLIDKLEKFKDEVEVMISQGKGEEYSEEKINELKTILSLLASEDKDDIHKKEEKARQDKELHQKEIEDQEAHQEEKIDKLKMKWYALLLKKNKRG